MSQTRPYRKDVNWIQAQDLLWQFTFKQDGSAWDLSDKDEITVLLTRNRDLSKVATDNEWKQTLTGGDVTLSGADNNVISGAVSEADMSIGSRSYYFIIYFNNDVKTTEVIFTVDVIDAQSGNSSASEWVIDIDTSSDTVSGQASQQLDASDIKTLYESNDDTNAFTDDEKTKLGTVEENAEVNETKRSLLGYREINIIFERNNNEEFVGTPVIKSEDFEGLTLSADSNSYFWVDVGETVSGLTKTVTGTAINSNSSGSVAIGNYGDFGDNIGIGLETISTSGGLTALYNVNIKIYD